MRRKRERWKSRETSRKTEARPGKLVEVEDLVLVEGGQEALFSLKGSIRNLFSNRCDNEQGRCVADAQGLFADLSGPRDYSRVRIVVWPDVEPGAARIKVRQRKALGRGISCANARESESGP